MKGYPQTASAVVGSGKNDKSLFSKVVATRNYRAQFYVGLKDRTAWGEELHHINDKLGQLMEMYLMAEIGFENEEIKELVTGMR